MLPQYNCNDQCCRESNVKIIYRLKSDKFVIVNIKSNFLSQQFFCFVKILTVLFTIYTAISIYNIQIERRLKSQTSRNLDEMDILYLLANERSNSRQVERRQQVDSPNNGNALPYGSGAVLERAKR